MQSRFLRLSVCASVFLMAGCGDEGGNSSASAGDLRADFTTAADALAAKTGAPGEKAEMPPATDPAVQAFEAQAAKAMTAIGTDALPIEGMESFKELCGKSTAIVGAYAAAGTSGTTGAAQQQKMQSNIEASMDRIFTPLLFSAHCNAAHLPFLDGQAKDAGPDKLEAMRMTGAGAFQQMLGLIQMAADETTGLERRRRIVDLLVQDAPNFAIGLNAAQRKQMIAATQELRPLLPPELQGQADKIRTGIEGAKCGAICSKT